MDMEINFPGGKKVDAIYKGFTIKTDQPEHEGGEGTALLLAIDSLLHVLLRVVSGRL